MDKYITNLKLIQNSKLIEEMGFKVRLIEEENIIKNPVIMDIKNNTQLAVERINDEINAKTADNRFISLNIDKASVELLKKSVLSSFGFTQELTLTSDTIIYKRNRSANDLFNDELMIFNNYHVKGLSDKVFDSILDMPSDMYVESNEIQKLLGTTRIVSFPNDSSSNNIGSENAFLIIYPTGFIKGMKKGYMGTYVGNKPNYYTTSLIDPEKYSKYAFKICESIYDKSAFKELNMIKSSFEEDYSKMLTYFEENKLSYINYAIERRNNEYNKYILPIDNEIKCMREYKKTK